jgi:succinate dehydrogenase / fumarate reductase iron-sulfur subunit
MLNYTRTQAFHKEQITVPVLVRRDSEKEFIFFSSSCPHLACSVAWDPPTRRFKCACHGGAFDLDGKVVAGPPPSPLERLPWKIENGEVLVEVS